MMPLEDIRCTLALCPTSLPRYAAALAGTVVATDPVSVDADYDNGAAVHGELGCWGWDGDTADRVAGEARDEAKSASSVHAP
jgi:hypothetical protein